MVGIVKFVKATQWLIMADTHGVFYLLARSLNLLGNEGCRACGPMVLPSIATGKIAGKPITANGIDWQ